MYRRLSQGFTLVELLVVLGIISIMATLMIGNFNASRQRANDAQRKADMKAVQTALRLYYNDYGQYPASLGNQIQGCGTGGTNTCAWGVNWTADGHNYMNELPVDFDPTLTYFYNLIDQDTYVLRACLEYQNDLQGKTFVPLAGTVWNCPSPRKMFELRS